jgi:hypothetical protein
VRTVSYRSSTPVYHRPQLWRHVVALDHPMAESTVSGACGRCSPPPLVVPSPSVHGTALDRPTRRRACWAGRRGMGVAQIGGAGSYWIPRRTSRARSTPARRDTRCSDMSIPAEMPAEVTTSPSSTNRSSVRTSIVGSSWASVSSELQCVVAGRCASRPAAANTSEPVREQAGGREYQRAGADARHQRHLETLLAHPVQL